MLFTFRCVRTPRCCINRSIVSPVLSSSLLKEGIRMRSCSNDVLSCTKLSIMIEPSGLVGRQLDPFDKSGAETVVFHFVQPGYSTPLRCSNLIDFAFWMALRLQQQIRS